ncbi:dihydrofolate reductase family protein [Mesorhizobium sp. ORM6]
MLVCADCNGGADGQDHLFHADVFGWLYRQIGRRYRLAGTRNRIAPAFQRHDEAGLAVLARRRMYETMRFWDSPDRELGATEVEWDFARAWRETPKIVFSTTLRQVGPNARLVNGDALSAVRSVKKETDGLIILGGADLAACLARAGLIDEYRLYMHPVVLGGGKPYFQSGLSLSLKPLGTESLTQGVTLLRHAPAN